MAETNLHFDASLLSTKPMNKTAISVRRNKTTTFTSNLNTSEPPAEMGLDEVTEAASVPFKWDHVPGRLKGNSFISEVKEFEAINRNLQKQVKEQRREEDDDIFSDALDTLSPKLSISNASEYDVLEAMKQTMPSKDFMLNRFLPAAKAMSVEQQRQYAVKQKPLPAVPKPMRQIRDIVQAGKRATPNRYESMVPSYYHEDIDDEESDEDEDSVYLSKRGCGMSPQLCFKSTSDMLNSLPDLKEKPNSPMTPSHEQVKSSKVAQLKSRFQSMKKFALDSIYKQKFEGRGESPVQKSIWKKKFNLGTEQFESNFSTVSAPASPYRQATCMSPYRAIGKSSPLHPSGFPGTRKETEVMRANRLNKHIRNKSKPQELLYPKSTSSVMEKTLYVDTENSSKIKDHSNTNVKILPETEISLPSEDAAGMVRKKPNSKENAVEENKNGFDLFPLAPPPPKKPSESWLLRNLPSLSSQIPSHRYLLHSQKKDLEENSTSVNKWETIVKTSYIHRDHIRYSEELVVPSKT